MVENIKKSILDEVKKYWEYANEEDLEGITVSKNGNYTIVNLVTASGQGGVVAILDDQEKLVHISNAEYGIVSTLYDGNVYTLCGIIHWGHPLSYTMTKTTFGTMDAWKETDEVEGFKLDDEGVYEAFQKGEGIKLEVKEDMFVISYGSKEIGIVR